ncbi:lipopolysaccharide kinase InaA family protein [Myxococcota bacterium]|nr:lipopolysaccharide kinase InaA family protein [Myxococcota bacterium]
MRLDRRSAGSSDLREFRNRETTWIVAGRFETSGRAAGLPTPGSVEKWLSVGPTPPGLRAGRAPTRVESLAGSSERVHVRRSLHGGWLAPLWHGYRGGLGRLRREIRLTALLRKQGAPVPQPAFVVAARKGLLWRAAFCTVHIEGALDAIQFLESLPDQHSIQQAAAAVGQAIAQVHQLGLLHPDLHLGNLMLRQENGEFRAWIIDLDGARLARRLSEKQRRRQLKWLERSVAKRSFTQRIGSLERQVFLQAYTSSLGTAPEEAALPA